KEAIVKVFPEIPNSVTETRVSVTIGIEKRGIKLSDEKTKEMIANVNESIVKFEKIVTKLGEVVKGMKAACFATSAGLIVKGLFANMGGKALARQQVMRSAGGWNEECARLVRENPSEYPTINECLRKNNSEINQDVERLGESFKKTNDKIKSLKDLPDVKKNADLLGEKYLETEFLPWYKNNQGKKLIKPDGSEDTKTIGEVFGDEKAIKQAYDDGVLGLEEMKDIVTYSAVNNKLGAQKVTSIAREIDNNNYYSKQKAEFEGVTIDSVNIGQAVNSLNYKDKQVAYVKAIDVKSEIKTGSITATTGKYAIVSVPNTAKSKELAGKTLLVPLTSGDGRWKPNNDVGAYVIKKGSSGVSLEIENIASTQGVREVLGEA
ncbi:MAG: hypothetical protein AABX65_02350, partial [Nanoarchaeota archaeon]